TTGMEAELVSLASLEPPAGRSVDSCIQSLTVGAGTAPRLCGFIFGGGLTVPTPLQRASVRRRGGVRYRCPRLPDTGYTSANPLGHRHTLWCSSRHTNLSWSQCVPPALASPALVSAQDVATMGCVMLPSSRHRRISAFHSLRLLDPTLTLLVFVVHARIEIAGAGVGAGHHRHEMAWHRRRRDTPKISPSAIYASSRDSDSPDLSSNSTRFYHRWWCQREIPPRLRWCDVVVVEISEAPLERRKGPVLALRAPKISTEP
ncbi:hypothetical protein LTR53_003843, partial [Teratosphaeriaceae sp. CCFEE 6253]